MDLKQIINILNNQGGIVMKFIPQEEYDSINMGDTILISEGFRGKIIKKHFYPDYKGSETAITYKIMAEIQVNKIND